MKTAELSMFIVEDDAAFRETFMDIMALRGVDVQGAGTGAEGLRQLQGGLRPSVIVLDVQLPDVHGFELCRRLKRMEAFKRTPIILLSASAQYSDARDRAEGLLAGASLFLAKPITMDRLWTEIGRLLS
ncbi:MAG: response regulator [Elusimicrobia bacterium]|nr:response regulator [Elusimicrobiota bacterium]MDE2236609.1 response regulator [Elusimicrobiota bacterium]MDE2424591.1 response regulator [Elusimicrobiota bacterium]